MYKKLLRLLTGAIAACAVAGAALAQPYPNKPIRMVVPFPPGGAAEFLAHVRANPGKVAYGSGNGTSILTTAQLALNEKLDMLHVPYKGDAPTTLDLIAGRVQVLIATPGSALPQVKEGRLRVLAALLPNRSPLVPEAPTAAEAGLRGMTISPWAGLFGPAGMPKDVVERIAREMKVVAAKPEVKAALDKIAFEVQASTPEDMAAILLQQLNLWKKTAADVNLERD